MQGGGIRRFWCEVLIRILLGYRLHPFPLVLFVYDFYHQVIDRDIMKASPPEVRVTAQFPPSPSIPAKAFRCELVDPGTDDQPTSVLLSVSRLNGWGSQLLSRRGGGSGLNDLDTRKMWSGYFLLDGFQFLHKIIIYTLHLLFLHRRKAGGTGDTSASFYFCSNTSA
jgi:hypothetical protein